MPLFTRRPLLEVSRGSHKARQVAGQPGQGSDFAGPPIGAETAIPDRQAGGTDRAEHAKSLLPKNSHMRAKIEEQKGLTFLS